MGFKLTARGEEYPRRVFPDRPTIGTSSPPKTWDFLPGGNKADRGIHRRLCFHHLLEKQNHDFLPEIQGYAVEGPKIQLNESTSLQISTQYGHISSGIRRFKYRPDGLL
jgi:hypothetical protein